jgi:hypothetical protein
MGKTEIVQSVILKKWYLARTNKDGIMSSDKREIPEQTLMRIVLDWFGKKIEENSAVHVGLKDENGLIYDIIIAKPNSLDKIKKVIKKMEGN